LRQTRSGSEEVDQFYFLRSATFNLRWGETGMKRCSRIFLVLCMFGLAGCETWRLKVAEVEHSTNARQQTNVTQPRQVAGTRNDLPLGGDSAFINSQPYLTVSVSAKPAPGAGGICDGNKIEGILRSRQQQAAVVMNLSEGISNLEVPLISLSSNTDPVSCGSDFPPRYLRSRSVVPTAEDVRIFFPVRVVSEITSKNKIDDWFKAFEGLAQVLAPASAGAPIAPVAVIVSSEMARRVLEEADRFGSTKNAASYSLFELKPGKRELDNEVKVFDVLVQPLSRLTGVEKGEAAPVAQMTFNITYLRSVLASPSPGGLSFRVPGGQLIGTRVRAFAPNSSTPETVDLGRLINRLANDSVVEAVMALKPTTEEDVITRACRRIRNVMASHFNALDQEATLYSLLRDSPLGRSNNAKRYYCVPKETADELHGMGVR
jgi:hypothetical protein